LLLVY